MMCVIHCVETVDRAQRAIMKYPNVQFGGKLLYSVVISEKLRLSCVVDTDIREVSSNKEN